jgi:hypothetical protein
MVKFTLWPFYPLKIFPVHLKWEAGWAPEPGWMFGEKKNPLPLWEFKTRNV